MQDERQVNELGDYSWGEGRIFLDCDNTNSAEYLVRKQNS